MSPNAPQDFKTFSPSSPQETSFQPPEEIPNDPAAVIAAEPLNLGLAGNDDHVVNIEPGPLEKVLARLRPISPPPVSTSASTRSLSPHADSTTQDLEGLQPMDSAGASVVVDDTNGEDEVEGRPPLHFTYQRQQPLKKENKSILVSNC